MVIGNSRFPWEKKNLAIADVGTGSVKNLSNPAGDVAIDPSWSHDGRLIAFVAAKDMGSYWSSTPNPFSAWKKTCTLWVENSDGLDAHPLSAAGGGVTQPVWSKDGSKILYSSDDSIWMIATDGNSPKSIVASGSSGKQDDLASIDYAWFQP